MALEPVSDQQGPELFGTLLLEAVQKPVEASMGATVLRPQPGAPCQPSTELTSPSPRAGRSSAGEASTPLPADQRRQPRPAAVLAAVVRPWGQPFSARKNRA